MPGKDKWEVNSWRTDKGVISGTGWEITDCFKDYSFLLDADSNVNPSVKSLLSDFLST